MSADDRDESSDSDFEEIREFIRNYYRNTVPEIQPPVQDQVTINSENRNNNVDANDSYEYFRTFSPTDPELQPSLQVPQNANPLPSYGRIVPSRSFDPVIQRPTRGQGDLSSGTNEEESLEEINEGIRRISRNFDAEVQSSLRGPQNTNPVRGRIFPSRGSGPLIQRPNRGQGGLSSGRDREETIEELRDYFRNYSPDFDIDIDYPAQAWRNPRSESGDSDPPRFFPVSTPSTSTESSAASLDDAALTNLFSDLAIVTQQAANITGTEYRLLIPPHIIGNLLGENAPVNPFPESAWIQATAGSQNPTIAWNMSPARRQQATVPTIAIFLIIILLILSRHRYPYNWMEFRY